MNLARPFKRETLNDKFKHNWTSEMSVFKGTLEEIEKRGISNENKQGTIKGLFKGTWTGAYKGPLKELRKATWKID